jgi:hypothetical protein
MYLPPNVTPLIQSMDRNVIKLTKSYYRKSLLAIIVANDPNITESLKNLTIKDAIINLMGAWNCLVSKMIAKCWRNILQVSENNKDKDDLYLSVLRTRDLDNVGPISEVSNLLNIVLPENTLRPGFYRVSTTKPGHRHITHIKIIYELLWNILLFRQICPIIEHNTVLWSSISTFYVTYKQKFPDGIVCTDDNYSCQYDITQ